MKIQQISLHNFRSIKDITFNISDYSLLVGENNVGKTAIISALRMFYEDEGAKFSRDIDFPKFHTNDNDSWIEIHFKTTIEEQKSLKNEYQSKDNMLRVRRYFQSSSSDLVKSSQSNIYGYEGGELSKNLFYGAKNISQAKLGKVVHIPEVSRSDDSLKVSGPSPFRDMLTFVMKRAVQDSNSFLDLRSAFEKFNTEFQEEASKEGFSVKSLVDSINNEILNWRIRFGVEINPVRPEDIIKNLVAHYIEDLNLDQRVKVSAFGQGLQRHLIYTLLRLSSQFKEQKEISKKEFSPDFVLLLFEEPEAFLHPSQQSLLNRSLHALAKGDGQQILITTHSPQFVSRNISEIPAICRLHKKGPITECYQILSNVLNDILDTNLSLHKHFQKVLEDNSADPELKKEISRKFSGIDNYEKKLDEESINYCLWLDAERSSLFFAKHVVICEGACEKTFFDYLTEKNLESIHHKQVYFLDAMGKFNIHRYMNLLDKLGITHSVVMDSDQDRNVHSIVNAFIEQNRKGTTKSIYAFENTLEDYLGIAPCREKYKKPIYVMSKYLSKEISIEKINAIEKVITSLSES